MGEVTCACPVHVPLGTAAAFRVARWSGTPASASVAVAAKRCARGYALKVAHAGSGPVILQRLLCPWHLPCKGTSRAQVSTHSTNLAKGTSNKQRSSQKRSSHQAHGKQSR